MLANRHLQPVAELLSGMSLKPAQSRARSKLLTLVTEAIERFGRDEYELISHYAQQTPEGKPKIEADGTFTLADPSRAEEFHTARNQLFDSLAEVSGPTYATHLADVAQLLADYDQKLSGQDAVAFDVLYDAVETATSETAKEG